MKIKYLFILALASATSVLNAEDSGTPAKDRHLILSVEDGDSSVVFYGSKTFAECRLFLPGPRQGNGVSTTTDVAWRRSPQREGRVSEFWYPRGAYVIV
jgi:hypothetical protein